MRALFFTPLIAGLLLTGCGGSDPTSPPAVSVFCKSPVTGAVPGVKSTTSGEAATTITTTVNTDCGDPVTNPAPVIVAPPGSTVVGG